MNLDVGCGDKRRGDVNVDIYKHFSPEIIYGENKPIHPDIQCDAHHLPFRLSIFEHVTCYSVLEHTESPLQMLNELLRVTKNTLTLYVPHFLGRSARTPGHKSYFSWLWFQLMLRGYRKTVQLLWNTVLRRKSEFRVKVPSYLLVTIEK